MMKREKKMSSKSFRVRTMNREALREMKKKCKTERKHDVMNREQAGKNHPSSSQNYFF